MFERAVCVLRAVADREKLVTDGIDARAPLAFAFVLFPIDRHEEDVALRENHDPIEARLGLGQLLTSRHFTRRRFREERADVAVVAVTSRADQRAVLQLEDFATVRKVHQMFV